MFDFIKENPILCLIAFLLVVSPSFLFGAMQFIAIVVFVIFILIVLGMVWFRWKVKKLQKEANKQGGATERNTKIYSSMSEKKVADDVGDYVEFEEIKDK